MAKREIRPPIMFRLHRDLVTELRAIAKARAVHQTRIVELALEEFLPRLVREEGLGIVVHARPRELAAAEPPSSEADRQAEEEPAPH